MPEKFEREIDEILSRIDAFPNGGRRRKNANQLGHRIGDLNRSLIVRLAHISAGQIMLAALGLMLFSYFFKALLGGLWVYGLTLGLILFFIAFVLSFRGGSTGRGSEPYYRGRPRSYYEPGSTPPVERLRQWWRRRRYRG